MNDPCGVPEIDRRYVKNYTPMPDVEKCPVLAMEELIIFGELVTVAPISRCPLTKTRIKMQEEPRWLVEDGSSTLPEGLQRRQDAHRGNQGPWQGSWLAEVLRL